MELRFGDTEKKMVMWSKEQARTVVFTTAFSVGRTDFVKTREKGNQDTDDESFHENSSCVGREERQYLSNAKRTGHFLDVKT